MRTVAIIQARMTSSRLPGKTLMRIGDHTLLEHTIRRAHQTNVDQVVVATSARGSDNPIHDECRRLKTACYRSSLHDVLHRYWTCAHHHQATRILRITADSPLHDPQISNRILELMETMNVDYATIVDYPAGIAMEAFTIQALDRAHTEATTQHDREHVITHMTNSGNGYRRILQHAPKQHIDRLPDLTVDTIHDLERLQQLHHRQPRLFKLGWDEIRPLLQQQKAAA